MNQTRTYHRASSVVFLKTNEAFGGLSNMAGGFSLSVNGFQIRTSEALYQACRFPHLPEVQRLIIKQKSPMTAKMKSKPHRKSSRSDWNRVRVKVMRWCLRAKLAQNWVAFSELLLETADRPIIEQSRKDDFWGAKPTDEDTLVGRNVLGRLLMELREEVKVENGASLLRVDPLTIPDFLLSGSPIEVVSAGDAVVEGGMEHVSTQSSRKQVDNSMVMQTSLLYEPAAEETRLLEYPPVKKADVRIVNLKPYPEMKDSGVEWLGEVPVHWEVRRLRNAVDMRVSNVDKHIKEGETPVRLCNYVDVYKNDYISKQMTFMHATATNDEIKRFRLMKDDVLITKDSETWDDIGVPALVTEPASDIISGYHLAILRPHVDDVMGSFLLRALQSKGLAYQFHTRANGVTRYGLSHSGIKSVWLPLPSLPEQAAIVRYLDYVERRIRRYVRAKQKLLNLLAEQKQVIIHRAVTRGLDPDVLLKPSGVEWLGEVPAHWEVRQLGRIGRFSKGNGGTKEDEVASGVPCVRYGDIYTSHRFFIKKSRTCVTEEKATDYTPIQYGDVLFAGSGETIEEIGKSAVNLISGLACCGGDVILFRPSIKVNANFFGYATDCTQAGHQKSCMGRGITIMHIYSDELKYMFVTLPPLPEQTAIVEYLDKTTAKIDTVIARTHREIELFSEYRTRLIADVVTGKVDVREAAAKLPDETDADDVLADGDANAELCMVAEYEHEI